MPTRPSPGGEQVALERHRERSRPPLEDATGFVDIRVGAGRFARPHLDRAEVKKILRDAKLARDFREEISQNRRLSGSDVKNVKACPWKVLGEATVKITDVGDTKEIAPLFARRQRDRH